MSGRPDPGRYPLTWEGRKAYWRALDKWTRGNRPAETTPGRPLESTEAASQPPEVPPHHLGHERPSGSITRNRTHHEGEPTMSARATITGNLGHKPEVTYTPSGKPVTALNIAATASHRDKSTGQWVDDGDPLWIRASFWGEEHTWLADALDKGTKVTVEGELVRRVFQRRDGTQGEGLEVKFPRFLGVIPRRPQQPQPAPVTPSGYQPPAQSGPAAQDPWGAPATDQPPF